MYFSAFWTSLVVDCEMRKDYGVGLSYCWNKFRILRDEFCFVIS